MTLVVGRCVLNGYRDKADELWSRLMLGILNPGLKSWANIIESSKDWVFGQSLIRTLGTAFLHLCDGNDVIK